MVGGGEVVVGEGAGVSEEEEGCRGLASMENWSLGFVKSFTA